jgi:hypothetical protein
VAKKKRAGTTKRSVARRKPVVRAKRARKRAPRKSADQVDLKAIRRDLEKSAALLEKLSTTRAIRTDAVRRRLETMMSELDALCDPDNPDGCGPHMVFPDPSLE